MFSKLRYWYVNWYYMGEHVPYHAQSFLIRFLMVVLNELLYLYLTYWSFGWLFHRLHCVLGAPKSQWLVGQVEAARVWLMRSMNHGFCHLDLNLNLHLNSWTWSWTGILKYYLSWIWRASSIGGWPMVGEWREVVDYLLALWNKVDELSMETLNLDQATWTSSWEPRILFNECVIAWLKCNCSILCCLTFFMACVLNYWYY